jgi:hypothetical protein
VGGLVIFVARLVDGSLPGETLHVAAGLALTAVYAAYQWTHWRRVAPWRARADYALGLLAALSMALVNLSGLWLALSWWRGRGGPVDYPAPLSAVHNIGGMIVLTFAAAHLGAVLRRDRTGR